MKRVVALPGDSVQIKDGILLVNGKVRVMNLKQKITDAGNAKEEIILGEDEYFVLGDNYAVSKDSRSTMVGCIHGNQIVEKLVPQKYINRD